MRKWGKQFRTEWLLLSRNWWLLLAVPAFAAWMVYDMANASAWESPNVYTRVYQFSYFGQTMTLGIAMLLGMLTVRRDTQQRVAEMLETWPLGNGTWLTAKFAAMFSYLSLYSVVMAVVTVGAYVRQEVPLATASDDIAFLFLQYELSYAVTLALGMALATWIRHRVVYLIGFCAWMFGTFFMEMFLIDSFRWYFLKTFHLNQLMDSALWSSDVWGAALVPDELMRSRLFVVLFTMCLLAAIVFTRHAHRPGRTFGLTKASMALCAVGLVSAGVWYGALWADRYGNYREEVAHYQSIDDYYAKHEDDNSAEASSSLPFRVKSYDLQVTKMGKQQIAVHAKLSLDPADIRDQAAITFTLNRMFDVEGVYADGQAVDFQRDWDLLTLSRDTIPADGKQVTLQVDYSGDVYHHSFMQQGSEYVSSFVTDDQVFLPYNEAWYPLPGEQTLYTVSPVGDLISMRDTVVPGTSDVKVTLKGFPRQVYTTFSISGGKVGEQTFQGTKVQGITLIAGELVQVQEQNLQLVTSPANRKDGEGFLRRWHDQVISYYEGWLPKRDDDAKQTFFYLPLDTANNFEDYLLSKENDSLLIKERPYRRLTEFTDVSGSFNLADTERLINLYLFDDAELYSFGDENVTPAFRTAYTYLYAREQLHLSHEEIMDSIGYRFEMPDVETTPELQVLEMVGQAVDRGDTPQVKKLLRHFYQTVSQFDIDVYDNQPDQGISWDAWRKAWKEYGLGE